MKFKELPPQYSMQYYLSSYRVLVFNDNKKAAIKDNQKAIDIRRLLRECEVLCFYTMENYIKEEEMIFIHLNISSKDYKKILGY